MTEPVAAPNSEGSPIATKTASPATERRRLQFGSYDEVIADIESLHTRPHQQLGNWSLPITVGHLANAMVASIDGVEFPVPWYIRLIGPWLIKPRLLKSFPPGVKLPRVTREKLVPQQIEYNVAIAQLRRAIERLKNESQRGRHPVVGSLTVDEWNRFHLRHAEMHLGFLVPE